MYKPEWAILAFFLTAALKPAHRIEHEATRAEAWNIYMFLLYLEIIVSVTGHKMGYLEGIDNYCRAGWKTVERVMVFTRIRQLKILKVENTEREDIAGHYKMKMYKACIRPQMWVYIHKQGCIQVLWQLFWRAASETLGSIKGYSTPHITKHKWNLNCLQNLQTR